MSKPKKPVKKALKVFTKYFTTTLKGYINFGINGYPSPQKMKGWWDKAFKKSKKGKK